jgi:S-methylmethionine-dependent homocysteine/selenocysteine methylase
MTQIQDSKFLLTGAGVETYLAFVQKFPLREFCAFEVFEDDEELRKLEEAMVDPIFNTAANHGADVLLDTLVWRAQPDYLDMLGYQSDAVPQLNRLAVECTKEAVARWRRTQGGKVSTNIFINGDVGPRGDGYRVESESSVEFAQRYHQLQIEALAEAGVDVITGLTMTNLNEAIGLVRAASNVGLPCIISPTVETDGTTPDGTPLGQFIEEVDKATGAKPMFYMVNCAHPIHLEPTLRRARGENAEWLERFSGFRANASRKSHEELDQSTELDRGYPEALASQMAHLQADFGLRLVGGCCGTDAEHIECIAAAVARSAHQRAAG